MQMKGLAITLGLGAVAGAVAVMMLPTHSTARQLVNKAADKMENAAGKVTDKINQQINHM